MGNDFLEPYYEFIKRISELKNSAVDIKNSEKMSLIISQFNGIDNSYCTFLISKKGNFDSDFYEKTIESTYQLFTKCLENLKKNEGKNYNEAEASLKLCFLFLPVFASVVEDYYSLFID